MDFYLLLILAATTFLEGPMHILFRLLSKDEKAEFSAFSFQVVAAVLFLPLVRDLPPISSVWVYPLLAGLLYGIGNIFNLWAYSIGEVSLLAPLRQLNLLFIFVLATALLGESITVLKLLAVVLMLLGLANMKKKESLTRSLKAVLDDKPCQLLFVFLLFFSLARIVDKKAMLFFPAAPYAFLMYVLPSLFIFLFITMKRELGELRRFFREKFLWIILTALVVGAKYTLFLKAVALADLSIVVLVTSAGTLVALGMSRVVLKEEVKARWIAAVLMVAGAAILMWKN